MPWTLDKSRARFDVELNKVEQEHFDEFQNAIQNQGLHPSKAAEGWDSNYKNLKGDQYTIRLSQANRASFLVDDATNTCTILQVGGHT
jgi:hypothetical protein